jgi:hypothetical protein
VVLVSWPIGPALTNVTRVSYVERYNRTRGAFMATPREEVERSIARALTDQWNPLGLGDSAEPHHEYDRYAHEVFNLLARGASDTQVARFLHRIERDELGHPELADVALTPLLTTLRALERTI